MFRDMDSSEYAVKREGDNAAALMEPISVPIKTEPEFEGTSEENLLENFAAIENVEVVYTSECASLREIDDAEVLMEPLFVPVKAELVFESTSEETIVEEKFEGGETDEDSTFHVTRYPEAQSSVANTCKTTNTPGLKGHSLHNNSAETSGINEVLLSHCLNRRRECPQGNIRISDASFYTSCMKERVRGENKAQNRNQLEMCRRKHSDAEEGCSSAKVNEKNFKKEMQNSSSKKLSSKQSGKQKKTRKSLHCDTCGKSFPSWFHLQNHARTHTGEKPFQCSLCNKMYSTKSNLIMHVKLHSEERPYKCSICDMSYKLSTQLNNHMWVHRDFKPFICRECGKTFIHNGNLSAHMRLHSGEKPYDCSVCGKAFTWSSSLSMHIRSHKPKKPNICTVCGMEFPHSGSFTIHMRIHTSDKSNRCTKVD